MYSCILAFLSIFVSSSFVLSLQLSCSTRAKYAIIVYLYITRNFLLSNNKPYACYPAQNNVVQRRVDIEWPCGAEASAPIECFFRAREIDISKEVRRCNIGVLRTSYNVIKGALFLDGVIQDAV